jgi:ketosteroid isomerase-like protein
MSRNHVAPWIASALLALLAGCGGAGPSDEFPQAAADGWLGSFNGGDVEGLLLTYSADARVMPPDAPTASGQDAITEFWRGYNPGQVRISLGDVEIRRLGDFWFREGDYTATFPDEGEPRVGKFVELWKKEGANWLLYRQMWNRNSPLGGPEPSPPVADEPA